VAADGSLWIVRWAPMHDLTPMPSTLLVLDGAGTQTATIDLSSLDADGNPNTASLRILTTATGEKAFVALDRLDDAHGDVSTQPSQMAIVDVATHSLEQVVTLAGRNPFGLMTVYEGSLWLADMGNRDDAAELDAGIEVFSPATRSTTLLISEAQLGGTVSSIALAGGCGAAIVYDTGINRTTLVAFDDAGHVVQPQAFGPTADYDLWGLFWEADGTLLVGDRTPPATSQTGFAVHTFTHDGSCALTRQNDLSLPFQPVAFGAASTRK
jgi:hypothetical protein